MRRILFAVLPAILFIFSSCGSGSADRKVPELATEMCKCFESMNKGLSPAATALYKEVASATKPSATLKNGLENMDPAEAAAVSTSLMSLDDENSEIAKCMEAFDRKYEKETTRDRKSLFNNLLEEMRKNSTCPIGAAMINITIEEGIPDGK